MEPLGSVLYLVSECLLVVLEAAMECSGSIAFKFCDVINVLHFAFQMVILK